MPNYTYDDFTRAAEAAGLSGSFDASDLTTAQKFPEYGLSLVSLKRDLGNAQTAEQRLLATEAMNQLRKNYGSYGVGEGANRTYATSFGSQIGQKMNDIGSYGPYSSAYGDQISRALSDIGSYGDFTYSQDSAYKDVLDRIINQKSFSYDPTNDPIFSSYKKAYNREGDRSAANALAAAAAATGGRASSYANMAAQQQANYFAGKLADVIPTLRSQALSEYNNQYDQLLRQMNAMASDRSNEYQLYLDRLTQMQQQLQNLQGQDATEYGRYTDTLGQMQQDLENLRAQDATDYSRYLDELNAAYQRERDAAADKQNEFDNALKVFQATGQITGALADYLGGGSTYAGAAATYTGGGYGGSPSGNTLTVAEKAIQEEVNAILRRYGTSQITGQTFKDADGKLISQITSWDDYQRLKELGGWTDAELNQAGIRYGYPTTTDANGNLTPAVAYTPVGGSPQTWEQVDAAGENYQTASQAFDTMKAGGASKAEVLAEIRSWYQSGDLTSSDYQRLYNQYRNMNASEFGTPAAAGSNLLTQLGNALKQAVQQANAAAAANPYAGYATDPVSAANASNSSSTKKSTGTVSAGTRTPGATTTPAASSSSSSSSGGNLLTQLGNALKNAVTNAAKSASSSSSKSTSSSSSSKSTSHKTGKF